MPNHIELMALFSLDLSPSSSSSSSSSSRSSFRQILIEDLAGRCLVSGIGPDKKGTTIVRCGEDGCLIYERRGGRFRWLDAYYQNEYGKVVDATGVGNAFLGAFAVGFKKSGGDEVVACCYGAVGASFVVEGVGVGGVVCSASGRGVGDGNGGEGEGSRG